MKEQIGIIKENLECSVWEIENMMRCIDDWNAELCGTPIWKHVYHTLHSLDQWFINPEDYNEPTFHKDGQNVLYIKSEESISAGSLFEYSQVIKKKLYSYLDCLNDENLAEPSGSKKRFFRIIKQFKHLHMHLGMIMAFIYERTGKWVYTSSTSRKIPEPDKFGRVFD